MAGILVLAGAGLAAAGAVALIAMPLPVPEAAPVDFARLRPAGKPNRFLLCPRALCGAAADAPSPVFDTGVETLAAAWHAIALQAPRMQLLNADRAARQYAYVQRSRVFGFPDIVTVRLVPVDAGHSTLAILSRSVYGYWDFGVNRRRVQGLVAQLKRDLRPAIGEAPPPPVASGAPE